MDHNKWRNINAAFIFVNIDMYKCKQLATLGELSCDYKTRQHLTGLKRSPCSRRWDDHVSIPALWGPWRSMFVPMSVIPALRSNISRQTELHYVDCAYLITTSSASFSTCRAARIQYWTTAICQSACPRWVCLRCHTLLAVYVLRWCPVSFLLYDAHTMQILCLINVLVCLIKERSSTIIIATEWSQQVHDSYT